MFIMKGPLMVGHYTPVDVPARWAQVLDRVKMLDPKAHIAGGAIRDLALDKPVKDVDIFIGEVKMNAPFIEKILGEQVNSRENYGNPWVAGEVLYKPKKMPQVNLILLREPLDMTENFERFDFGVCRAGFQGSYAACTQDFVTDAENREFVLRTCNSLMAFQASMKRWRRFQEKFQDWKLRILPEFEYYATAEARWAAEEEIAA